MQNSPLAIAFLDAAFCFGLRSESRIIAIDWAKRDRKKYGRCVLLSGQGKKEVGQETTPDLFAGVFLGL